MGAEPTKCPSCGRLFARDKASCPFCGGAAPALPAKKPEPVRCKACSRLYAPSLAECPFCAGGGVSAPRAAPPKANPSDGAADEIPNGARVLLAGAGAAIALAVAVWVYYDTTDTRIFHYSALAAAPLGLGLLYLLSRGAAVDAARAWGGPFYALQLKPSGDAMSRAPYLVPWGLATVPCACLLYSLSMLINGLGSGPRVALSCASLMRAGSSVRYQCAVPGGGGERGTVRAEQLPGVVPRFEMDGRKGALGIWIVDKKSIRAPERALDRPPPELLAPGSKGLFKEP